MYGIDQYTKLLLHCNGADTSQTFIDSATGKTVTAVGTAQVDTAQSVFGGASLLLDGNSDYLSLADSEDWNFGSGDFTIDFWVRFATLPAEGNKIFILNQRYNASNFTEISILKTGGLYYWAHDAYSGGVQITGYDRLTTVSTNTWYHVAFVRNGTECYWFQGGAKCGTTIASGEITMPNIAALLEIGRWSGGGYYLNGGTDEFRVSKGIARWTANFTPPTSAYSRAGGSFLLRLI